MNNEIYQGESFFYSINKVLIPVTLDDHVFLMHPKFQEKYEKQEGHCPPLFRSWQKVSLPTIKLYTKKPFYFKLNTITPISVLLKKEILYQYKVGDYPGIAQDIFYIPDILYLENYKNLILSQTLRKIEISL